MRHLAVLGLPAVVAFAAFACTSDDDGGTSAGADAGADGGTPAAPGVSVVIPDPAPALTMPGEYGCEGCPDADFGAFEIEAESDTSMAFNGFVARADGNGEFYLESEGGQRIRGPIPTTRGTFGFTVPLFCGTQLLKCIWKNAAGASVSVLRIATTDCTPADIRITLSWDDRGRDFDLHLVKEGGRINDPETDCSSQSCQRGELDWGEPDEAADNPRKDVDNTHSFGPENIFYARPEDGTYTVLVEHWGAMGSPDADGLVTINVLDEPPVVVEITDLAPHHVFTAATIAWPSKRVSAVGETYDCTDEWSDGCTAALP